MIPIFRVIDSKNNLIWDVRQIEWSREKTIYYIRGWYKEKGKDMPIGVMKNQVTTKAWNRLKLEQYNYDSKTWVEVAK